MIGLNAADSERAWDAVLARDRACDGQFVYAVTSTHVYCRPSCPSRRPLRRNVRFFATPSAARSAGFRACLRCRPDSSLGDPADVAVHDALGFLEAHFEENVTLDTLAAEVGLSPFYLQRQFKERTGMTPREYVTSLRMTRFRNRARGGNGIARATYEAGFGSSRGLYQAARSGLGMTPGQYARGGSGLEISYSIEECALGRLLIATTADGVCAVLLGESDDELRADLEREFANATLTHSATERRDWVQNVLQHLDDARIPLAVPLDYHGTPFQVRVWKALRALKPGDKRSYSAVATALGQPHSTRAVAQACARNTIAVLVPCHRVVRKDGRLGGYRWGVARKAQLLERESAAPAG